MISSDDIASDCTGPDDGSSRIDQACSRFENDLERAEQNRDPLPNWEGYRYPTSDQWERMTLEQRLLELKEEYEEKWQMIGNDHCYSIRQLRQLANNGQLHPTDRLRNNKTETGDESYACALLKGLYTFDNHELHDVLGIGGMGVVYDSWDSLLNRRVALKIIRERLDGLEARILFEVEAKAIASLNHPHIVTVYVFGVFDDQPYMSLEHIDGNNLSEALHTFQLPEIDPKTKKDKDGVAWTKMAISNRITQIIRLMTLLARAVHHAHIHGVVHRDLKPANVLLANGAEGTYNDLSVPLSTGDLIPKIGDFGLAKLLPQGMDQAETVKICGTPEYMAPEQAADVKMIGPTTDVHGLGAILYKLLTGHAPFIGDDRLSILNKVKNEVPRNPTSLNMLVPADLGTICLKCLEKYPNNRYSSAADLADDLARFSGGRPIQARPASKFERCWRWYWRNRKVAFPTTAFLLSSVVVLVVLVLLAFAEKEREAAEARRKIAENNEQNVRDEKIHEEAEKIRQELKRHRVEARSHIAGVRSLWDDNKQSDPLKQVFEQIQKFNESERLAVRAQEALTDLTGPKTTQDPQDPFWNDKRDELRKETVRWLTTLDLKPSRSILLPEGSPPGFPSVTLHPNESRIAVLYPGSPKIFVLDGEGRIQRILNVPRTFTKKARQEKRVVQQSMRVRKVTSSVNWAIARFEYVTLGKASGNTGSRDVRLEYQIGEEVLTWKGAETEPQQEIRPGSEPLIPFGHLNVSSNRFTITTTGSRDPSKRRLLLQDWNPESSPIEIWKPDNSDEEGPHSVVLGADHRAVFIRGSSHLYVVDSLTGAVAKTPLDKEQQTEIRYSHLIPCRQGVALIEQRTTRGREESPRLLFFTVNIPSLNAEWIPIPTPALSFDSKGDLLVIGGEDHLIRSWSKGRRKWLSGIPYLNGDKKNVALASFGEFRPSLEDLTRDLEVSAPWETYVPDRSGSTRATRLTAPISIKEQVAYVPPKAYQTWQPLPTKNSFLLQRREAVSSGQSRLVTEILNPEQGTSSLRFPTSGKVRLLAKDSLSPDGRFAVVIEKEQEQMVDLVLCSLVSGKVLGKLGRYPLPPELKSMERSLWTHSSFVSIEGQDWLLISRPLGKRGPVELEVWKLPEVRLVGKLRLRSMHHRAIPAPDASRVLLLGGNWLLGTRFIEVINLPEAQRICTLQNFSRAIQHTPRVVTDKWYIAVWKTIDASKPAHVTAWNLTTGERHDLDRQPWINNALVDVQLSPQGDKVLLCGRLHDNGKAHVELWDLKNLKQIRKRTYRTEGMPAIVAVHEHFGTVEMREKAGQQSRGVVRWRWSNGEDVLEIPDTSQLFAWTRDSENRWGWKLWRKTNGAVYLQKGNIGKRIRLQDFGANSGRIRNVLWPKPRGLSLVIEGQAGGVWDVTSGKKIIAFPPSTKCLSFDPSGRWLLSLDYSTHKVQIWDVKKEVLAHEAQPQSLDPSFHPSKTVLKLHPNGKSLAVLSQGILSFWDLEDNKVLRTIKKHGHFGPVRCVAQNSKLVASGDDEGIVHLWDRETGQHVRVLKDHPSGIARLAFDDTGKKLATVGVDGKVSLWDVTTMQRNWLESVSDPTDQIANVVFHPRKPLLALCTFAGRLIIREVRTGKRKVDCLLKGSPRLLCLAFSPEGDRLVLGSRGGQVYLFDVGAQLILSDDRELTLPGFSSRDSVYQVSFLGSTDLIVTGGYLVQFWSATNRREICSLSARKGPVRRLFFDEKRRKLTLVDQGQGVLVLDVGGLQHQLVFGQRGLGIPGFPTTKWQSANRETPNSPHWQDWERKANRYVQSKQWSQALWAFSKALKLQSREPRLWIGRGRVYGMTGDPDLAARDQRHARDLLQQR